MCYQVCKMKRRAVLVGLVLWGASGCLSPSLPLPPPYEPSVGPSSKGADYVHLEGSGVEGNAFVLIFNPDAPRENAGVIVTADGFGKWSADVYAHRGDTLRVWQEIMGKPSATITVTIK